MPLVRARLRIDILAVDILRFGDEGGAAIAAFRVALFEAEELDFAGDEVDEVTAHCCGSARNEARRV